MLVLTRKKGQSIVIGENIRISIEEVSGESVRIELKHPKMFLSTALKFLKLLKRKISVLPGKQV